MTPLFGWIPWNRHAPSQGEGKAANVNGASQVNECDRCCVTARAMAFVRHQWIAAGIDRE
jgi:hypothetical protein